MIYYPLNLLKVVHGFIMVKSLFDLIYHHFITVNITHLIGIFYFLICKIEVRISDLSHLFTQKVDFL
jgi:hypothetical protein